MRLLRLLLHRWLPRRAPVTDADGPRYVAPVSYRRTRHS